MKEQIEIFKRRGIPREVLVTLRNKAGNKCSFPNCNSSLVTSDGRLIGEVATIKPISPNGPRNDNLATIDEYYLDENLIYLCPTHHRQIDIEPEIYSVEFLRKLKLKHETQFHSVSTTTNTNIEIPSGLSLEEILKFWDENKENSNEEFWQMFFSNHPLIISFLFPNPVVKLGEKVYFGGKDLNNRGGNIGDYIFQNKLARSVVIVEIKTPKTKVLGSQYRANTYTVSNELSGAVIQTLNYKTEIQRDFHRLVYQTDKQFEVVEPSCIIIIGNLANEILNEKQMRSLDLFRNSLNNLTIITYDELFEKLKMVKELKG